MRYIKHYENKKEKYVVAFNMKIYEVIREDDTQYWVKYVAEYDQKTKMIEPVYNSQTFHFSKSISDYVSDNLEDCENEIFSMLKRIDINNYNEDDYVVLKDHFVNKEYSLIAKIIIKDIENKIYKMARFNTITFIEDLEYYRIYDIERMATKKEIDEFDLMSSANKYNL